MRRLARGDRSQAELVERGQVVVSRHTGLGAGHDGAVDRTREALLRSLLGNGDRLEPLIGHGLSLCLEAPPAIAVPELDSVSLCDWEI